MKRTIFLSIAASMLLLGACGKEDDPNVNTGSVDDGEKTSEFGSIDHGIDESGEVGFNLSGETIEEATNVSEEEKKLILQAFDEYMAAFNSQDVDRYMETLSKNPKGFSIEEERTYTEDVFQEYEVSREATDVTIVKFNEDENEAQVFANLQTVFKQKSTALETKPTGRQVTVMVKEDDGWKVTAVHYIGDADKPQ
ncbi:MULTISPECIES: nuclear transport factor 2 family protein [Sporosarcina]|uniref:Nuclear transport factor 2 family protein n=1 Tax=Sporosarcina contaminans TaxID=633403 RepID=A0ABW3TWE7_9BACL